ncbi:MAG: hypothetical protein Q9162_000678 [Coniocarpon cinnabarinum]
MPGRGRESTQAGIRPLGGVDSDAPMTRPPIQDPARAQAETSADLLDQIIAQFDKQRDVATRTAEDVNDLVESLWVSLKKQLAEAKRMPEAHEAKVRDLERQIARLKEDRDEKSNQFNYALASRTKMKKEMSLLTEKLAKQQTTVDAAKVDKVAAEASLAPTAARLNELNNLGSRMHNLVISRLRDLCAHSEKYDACDPADERGKARLEKEFNDMIDLLQKGWKHVEQQYMRDTREGEFPALQIHQEEDTYARALSEHETLDHDNAPAQPAEVTDDGDMNGTGSDERGVGEDEGDQRAQRQGSDGMFVGEGSEDRPHTSHALNQASYTPSKRVEGDDVSVFAEAHQPMGPAARYEA